MSGGKGKMELLRAEGGAIMVFACLWIPLMVLLAIFVVDVANWFEHKRHLQMQADAGALAAAREFGVIDPDAPGQGCNRAAIEARAKQYAGIEGSPLYNEQIGGTTPDNVHFLLNSATWFNQATPVDDTVVEGDPCTASMIDVKLTETNLPWYFRIAQVPFINTRARVSIFQQDWAQGALPVGVPDPRPKQARVLFVDETTGQTLATRDLIRDGTSNGLSMWSNATDPAPVQIDSAHVGVRVILSGSSTNIDCGQPLVECYDTESSDGLLHIRGWSAGSSAPDARDVTLTAGSCPDPYFSNEADTCTIGVQAKFDFGAAPDTVGAELRAVLGRQTVDLSYDSASDTWTSPTTLDVDPDEGPIRVDLEWEKTQNCTESCTGTIANVQRTFAGSDARSGPLQLAQVEENGALLANSFERCSTESCLHDLVVRIGIQSSLENARDVNDPIVSLRVVGGSQNQALDCDTTIPNLRDELAQGCGPAYEVNDGTACPDLTEPYDCVPLQTGTQRNQVAAGMNLRVYGDEKATVCSRPNNWSSFPNIPLDDPRIVQVFLTPFGTFQGSGNESIPVTGFATFYATGWAGQGKGFKNPCEGQGDDPVPGGEGGYLVGHFIKYVQSLNTGGGTEPCVITGFGSCIASLTE